MDSPGTPSPPKSKKTCQIPTPHCFKKGEQAESVAGALSSTPKRSARALNLSSVAKVQLVKVSDVPVPFIELNFLKAFEKKLRKSLEIKQCHEKPLICKLVTYSKITNSVIIEFSSDEIAHKVIRLHQLRMMNNTLSFKPADAAGGLDLFHDVSAISTSLHDEETSFLKSSVMQDVSHHEGADKDIFTIDGISMTSVEDSCSSECTEKNQVTVASGENENLFVMDNNSNIHQSHSDILTHKVKVYVKNNTDDLQEDLLVSMIAAAMQELQLVQLNSPDDDIIKSCIKEENCSCILEFASADLALKACALDGMEFLGSSLCIETVSDSNITVMVLNVPSGKEVLVRTYLEAYFKKMGLSLNGQPIIQDLFVRNDAVLLKPPSSSSSSATSGLEEAYKDGNNVVAKNAQSVCLSSKTCSQQTVNYLPVASCSSDVPKEAAESKTGEHADHLNQNYVFTADNLLNGEQFVEMKRADYLMKEDAGKVFLQKLVLTRRLFYNKQNFSSAYARLMAEVREAGVDVDLRDIMKRRAYWQDVHNAVKRGKQSSLYIQPLRVIFEEAPIESLHGTEYYLSDDQQLDSQLVDPMKVAATAAMFSKGAVFSIPAARYIDISALLLAPRAAVRSPSS